MAHTGLDAADAVISKWQGVTASELSTSQSFRSDLCSLMGVDTPHPTPEQDMFERPITFLHEDGGGSAGRIDLYVRGAFVLCWSQRSLRPTPTPRALRMPCSAPAAKPKPTPLHCPPWTILLR